MTVPSISFSGLATPFDANAVIDQLLAAERIPMLQLQARRAEYEAKDQAWVEINTRLSALRSALDDIGRIGGMVTAASSNEAAVTASAALGAAPGSLSFTVDRLAATHQMASVAAFADPEAAVGAGDLTITVGGEDFVFAAGTETTYQELAAGITGLGAGVSASVIEVDEGSYRLLVTATATGEAAEFTVASTIAGFDTFEITQQAADAQLSIGGLTIERSSNTVTDLLPGVTVHLVAETDQPVTVTATRDEAAIADAVEELVTQLNAVIDTIADATRYDSESGAAGILVGDATARTLLADLRSALSGAVGGTSTTLVPSAIGISIDRTGSFVFDRGALEQALATDYDNVAGLLNGDVGDRLDTALDLAEGIDGSVARARDRWQASIDDLDDRIDAWEDRLDMREALLIRQFAALDTALATLNAQSQWLTQQLATLNQQQT